MANLIEKLFSNSDVEKLADENYLKPNAEQVKELSERITKAEETVAQIIAADNDLLKEMQALNAPPVKDQKEFTSDFKVFLASLKDKAQQKPPRTQREILADQNALTEYKEQFARNVLSGIDRELTSLRIIQKEKIEKLETTLENGSNTDAITELFNTAASDYNALNARLWAISNKMPLQFNYAGDYCKLKRSTLQKRQEKATRDAANTRQHAQMLHDAFSPK